MKFCGECGTRLEAAPPPPAAPKPSAERRQITVLFCDVVGSTALSERLDPEDLRDVLNLYQQTAVDAVTRHRGTVGKYLGDGILVYFGFPTAGEDDPVRAVRAALEMVARVGGLADRLERDFGTRLRTRVGIHTGVVIAGEVGATEQRVVDIVGETPNIAARLQDLAAPDSVVVSADTHRLVSRFFRTVTMGERMLKGLSRPMETFTVEGETGARNRLEGVHLNPLVGRDAELARLRELWGRARTGEGHAVLLSGEAGIGKSRLTVALEDEIGDAAHVVAMSAYSHGANSAFAPVAEMLRARMGIESADSDAARLLKIEGYAEGFEIEGAVPLLADLLSVPHERALDLSPEAKRARTEELLLEILAARSSVGPVLVTVEDLHWVDPSTLRLLDLHMARMRGQRVLTVYTARPEFVPSWPDEHFSRLDLARLDASGTSQLVRAVTGGAELPPDVVAQILQKTEGVPLYVEEMVSAVVEARVPGHSLTIPTTLQDSLMARLDRLNPTKELIQFASLLGRTFSRRLLAVVCDLSEPALELALASVVAADMIHPDGENYRFKHALIQDAAYDSMLRSTRQERHAKVAEALRSHFPEILRDAPEDVARHLTEGGRNADAVEFWERAGRRALARAANQEAIGHLRQALQALAATPEGPERLIRELDLQTAVGPALMSTRGFAAAEVELAYARAREICGLLGKSDRLFPVLWGLFAFYFVKGDLRTAEELAQEVYAIAMATDDADLRRLAHHAVGYNLYYQGDYAGAWHHAERGLALYDPATERDWTLAYQLSSTVCQRIFGGGALWFLGREEESRATLDAAIALARELQHPPTLAYALACRCYFEQTHGDAEAVSAMGAENLGVSAEIGAVLWTAASLMFLGWARAERGDAAGWEQFDQGYAIYGMTGTNLIHPQVRLMQAQRLRREARPEEALERLQRALEQSARTTEGHLEPEVYRLRGEILGEMGRREEAEASLRRAIDRARDQGALPLAARAESSLAALALL